MYAETFASNLKIARKKSGFTQDEVVSDIGISRSALAGYETGRTEPNLEILGKLADFYQVSVDWLLGINSINNAG